MAESSHCFWSSFCSAKRTDVAPVIVPSSVTTLVFRLSRLVSELSAWDETGFLTLTWFKGHGPHLERQHPVGARRAVSGKVERFGSEIQVAHPEYLLPEERARLQLNELFRRAGFVTVEIEFR